MAVKKTLAQAGDMLAIPYHDGHAIYGRVIYADAPGTKAKQKRGLYLEVLDRDVASGDDVAEVVRAPVLLGPMQVTPEFVRDGVWKIVGNVTATVAEQVLPYFTDGQGLVNYFYERVPDTAENQARAIDERVAPPELVPEIVRAARGLEPWFPGYDDFKPARG